ncbi:MAG TPA: LysR family transcriptional regulator [Gammaproteobacteria bacterium]|nr:LysR family transcriptional regulator [Gammaproteobacteria bacterium]
MDRLTAMRVFVHVVEMGSFSAASARLGMSRAAASKYVSQLESQLGGRLLHRTTRHVSTTESGRLYYERCREILHNLEEADGVVSGLSQEPSGTLRVSAPTNFASLHLAPLVARFMRDYPAVKVEMVCTDRYVDLVDEGFDMAVRVSNAPDSNLIARYLTRCRHVIVASPDYLANHPAPKTPDDLRDHACLLFAHTAGAIWPFAKDGKDYSVKIKEVFKSNNPDLLTEAAIAGMGVTMLPTFNSSDAIRRGELKMLLEDYDLLDLPIYAIYASRRFLPAKTRLFIDYLKEHLSDPPYWDHVLTVRT